MTNSARTLHRQTIDASLPLLVNRFSSPDYAGAQVELWVFDGVAHRRAAEQKLKSLGVKARVHSAYKPLVHALLDDVNLSNATDVTIHYPVLEGLPATRFLLEAYPAMDVVANLIGDTHPCRFEAMAPSSGKAIYRIDWLDSAGAQHGVDVFAPNRARTDHTGKSVTSNCGWVRVSGAKDAALNRDEVLIADQEQAFSAIMQCLHDQAWVGDTPYFDRLDMKVSAPFYDRDLPLEGEWISTAEAMHEDLYFSALELLKVKQGLEETERTFGPGQLAPMITGSDADVIEIEVNATTDPHLALDCASTPDVAHSDRAMGWCPPLSTSPLDQVAKADHWLAPDAIKLCLEQLGGEGLKADSRRGRPVLARHLAGEGSPLMITAGQHSNETSGPIGALRAATVLKEANHAFSIAPLINPDGFALFRELCQTYPRHMNHAARYTAGGNDLEYVPRGFENDIHHQVQALTDTKLHLNLHGYPSHEWTRPFTGYIPRGLDFWTLPKGFALIVRYKNGWKDHANAILHGMIDALSGYGPLVDFNCEQLSRYNHYTGGNKPFQVLKDIAFIMDEVNDGVFPITIITEAPDETVYGDSFVLQHTAQMISVVSAAEAANEIELHNVLPSFS